MQFVVELELGHLPVDVIWVDELELAQSASLLKFLSPLQRRKNAKEQSYYCIVDPSASTTAI